MVIKKIIMINIIFLVLLTSVSLVSGNSDNTTNLEITDIRGGIFGVTADVKNIGLVDAENFTITLSVKGGLFNNINLIQTCSGCGNCGTTIPAGEIKSESTRESGLIFGFGRINIEVTAEASNADLVVENTEGFVLGPFILIF
jgi:hypothetical protein